jgi:subtilisin-like proprotein convertase family protein
VNLISLQSISKMDRELSGDTIAMIGGTPQLIFSRCWNSPGNERAAQYIFEKFQSYGYNAKYMVNSSTSKNVYVVKTGTKYPNRKFVMGAHYDNILAIQPGPNDTVHGADNNASGVSALLETARLMANINTDYTIVFIAFDENERSPYCLGSKAYADSCYFRGDTLIGVLNSDNIAYDSLQLNIIDVLPNSSSMNLFYDFRYCNQVYQIGVIDSLNIYPQNPGDHHSFWDRNYKAVELFEHFNPYSYLAGDTFGKFNLPFFLKNVKLGVATMLSWGMDCCPNIFHNPLTSGTDTTARMVTFEVHYPLPIASGSNAPRLYYKLNNGSYISLNPISHSGYYYNFVLPGFPSGSKVSYYFAIQDSTESYVTTSPFGGSGTNPPGLVPPSTPYVYYIYKNESFYSSVIPKPINDMEFTYDTIYVPEQGILFDLKITVNINHTNDGDLLIMLLTPGSSTTLCQFVGEGGQNFTGTIFDDTASKSITQGVPPFTGRFRPSGSLSNLNGQLIHGNWILKIYDSKADDHGTLLNWNIRIKYANQVGIKEIESTVQGYKLYQNYPNPFNPKTNIRFDIKKSSYVEIKIFDIAGRLISVLVNEKMNAGSYSVGWDASAHPSGVYFYRISIDGGKSFTETKKMVIVK